MGSGRINLERAIEKFQSDIGKTFGEQTVSIILYGSAVTEDFDPNRSDINFLIVLSEEGLNRVGSVQPLVKQWRKRNIRIPIFLTKAYIDASLDSFPLEFLNMKSAYRVIRGKDVLDPIRIRKKDLRLQCERELKTKLLQLRQGYILTAGNTRALRYLIVDSIVAFTSIFRGLLFLHGIEAPETRQGILLTACREFGLDEGLFSVLLSVKKYETKLTRSQLEKNVERYIAQVVTLSKTIDRMKV